VKAGLLPRLAPHVIAIDEAATSDLEPRLLARVRRACPAICPEATLVEALAEVRRGTVLPSGSKLLIVLDQFEQWLHARKDGPESELLLALRQCDGDRLQALIIVRVDFWMASSRFMKQLEVRVVEGENAAAVDLFPLAHARKVLASFGAAYGALPASPSAMGPDQQSFVERAVAMIDEGGAVTPVRLALFAEMVKGRPWTDESLRDLGGAVGIGVRFLDETFVSQTAPPEHRLHADAASRVLAALLPGPGADIKGHVRSHHELLDAAGYADDSGRFDALMRILDAETRLLTPMVAADPTTTPEAPGYYQLTHDYLVPSIREWLARKQRETRRGRAELKLADRASFWGAKPERKQLPSLMEWASIRAFTDRATWSVAQRAMMRAAARYHLMRAGRVAMAGAALGLVLLFVRGKLDEEHRRVQAHGMVRRLLDADVAQVPSIVAELAGYRRWADPELRRAVVDPSTRLAPRRRARIALLPVDAGQAPALLEAMLAAEPDEFLVVRDALRPRRAELIPTLWQAAESPGGPAGAAFQAAVALASYDPESPRWANRAAPVARQLAGEPSLLVTAWVDMLRPVRGRLVPALADLLRDGAGDDPLVASILADYAADRPELLAGLVGDAGPAEFAVLLSSKWRDGPSSAEALETALAGLVATYRAGAQDRTAGSIANTAIALLRLGRADAVWPFLERGSDPRIRGHLIDRMGPLGCDPTILVDRLRLEADASKRSALLLALGRCGSDQLPEARRSDLAPEILALYRDAPDASLHAAAWWLLRTWGRGDQARAAVDGLATGRVEGARRWYFTRDGQTMVLLAGEGEFHMGSPDDEPWRVNNEGRKIVRVRPFDIAATEVTVGQFRLFLDQTPDLRERYAEFAGADPDLPQTRVTWYHAVAYCNWLSEREGLPREQWAYVPNSEGHYAAGMRIPADFLTRTGYRLPIESEWEYACRAGTTTSTSFGDSGELILRYACCLVNSDDHPFPVGSLMPNTFGLFDMHGNAFEWCQDEDGHPDEDTPIEEDIVSDSDNRLVRGGGFLSHPRHIRSAGRYRDLPILRNNTGGLRPVRSRPGAGR
jgi:eukaryotic-like serine/threonine-protein kinase